MSVRIGSNIGSLTAQRRLGESTSSLEKTYVRLASGQRINRASDDAAGLAIADALNAKGRIYSRAMKNISDGMSVISIADSAISELSAITTRILELAEQSANGPYSDTQRIAIDNEAQALSDEYFRISRETQFNGIKLFDGSLQGLSLQAGFGDEGVLQSSLGGKMGSGELGAAVDTAIASNSFSVALGDVNCDGILDVVTSNNDTNNASVLIGIGDGTFRPKLDFATGAAPRGVDLSDLNGDGMLDLIVGSNGGDGVSTLLGNGDGTFKAKTDTPTGYAVEAIAVEDLDRDGNLDVIAGGASEFSISVLKGRGDGTFAEKKDFASGGGPVSIVTSDLNNDGMVDIATANWGDSTIGVHTGNGNGTFNDPILFDAVEVPWGLATGDLNKDGITDLVSSNPFGFCMGVFLGNGDGTFGPITTYDVGNPYSVALGDMNGDGVLDIVSPNRFARTISVLLGNGDGTFQEKNDFGMAAQPYDVALGDLDGDGVLDVATSSRGQSCVSSMLGTTRDGIAPLLTFSLRTKADALQALAPVNRKLQSLTLQRGVLGAFQARLGSAVSTLDSMTENFEAAESRIRDADIGQETANLTRTQIVQQAASAVLAQANQQPQLALTLLRNV